MNNTIGEYIRFLRKQKKLTLVQLAEKIDLSQPYLSQIENNQREKISPDLLEKLAAVLDADYVDLLKKAGYGFIDEVLGNKPSQGNLVFNVDFAEVTKTSDGVQETRQLSKEEVLKRFFNMESILTKEELNYKGIIFNDNDRQLLTTFLEALISGRN